MKLEPAHSLLHQASKPLEAKFRASWIVTTASIALVTFVILGIYSETATSILLTWESSQAYNHGYLIVPISLALLWRKRRELACIAPRPDSIGFFLVGLAGACWLVAMAGQVQILKQYSMVAMIFATVVALAGRRAAAAMAFPLAFLLFTVPFGEGFIPRLMDWTADVTVAALRITGIPVFREGTFFTIPSGRWSVIEACSGLRYLIAAVTVGTLFAYLNYRSWRKRAAFMLASIVVPIIANFARAYVLVMTGHLSNMRYGVGADHILFGWFFFGVIFAVLIWLASMWSDPVPASTPESLGEQAPLPQRQRLAASFVVVIALVLAWPLYAAHLERPDSERSITLRAPAGATGWEIDPRPLTDWRPHYQGAVASDFSVYRKNQYAVALYIGYYRDQRQGKELVSSQNVLVPSTDDVWMNVGSGLHDVQLVQEKLRVKQTRLRSPQQRLLVWDWYRISEIDLSSPYLAKALLARDKLLGRSDDSAILIVAAPYDERPAQAAEALQLFLRDMRGSIDMALAAAKQEAMQ